MSFPDYIFCRVNLLQNHGLDTHILQSTPVDNTFVLPGNGYSNGLDPKLPSNKHNDDLDTVLPSNSNILEVLLNDLDSNISTHDKMSSLSKASSVDSKLNIPLERSRSLNTNRSRSRTSDINAVTKIEISQSGNLSSVRGSAGNRSIDNDNDSESTDPISSGILDHLASELKSAVSIDEFKSDTQIVREKENKAEHCKDPVDNPMLGIQKNPSQAAVNRADPLHDRQEICDLLDIKKKVDTRKIAVIIIKFEQWGFTIQ